LLPFWSLLRNGRLIHVQRVAAVAAETRIKENAVVERACVGLLGEARITVNVGCAVVCAAIVGINRVCVSGGEAATARYIALCLRANLFSRHRDPASDCDATTRVKPLIIIAKIMNFIIRPSVVQTPGELPLRVFFSAKSTQNRRPSLK
jgi:hypothetical protein